MKRHIVDKVAPDTASPLRRLLPMLAVFFLLALVGPLFLNAYWTKTFTAVACLTLASASVGLLFGQLGMVSLCQFAVAGVGGWFTLRVVHGSGVPFELALIAGGCVASLFGLLTGLPALRMRGLYLALVSLMVAAAFQVVINVTGFPDGGPGWLGKIVNGQRTLIDRPWIARHDTAYLRYVLVVVAIGLASIEWHRATMPGRAWGVIRKGEAAATAAGVNVVAYKAWAFALAGFLSGIAGGLLAGNNGQLDSSGFPVAQSILLFALTVVGGAYHWTGAIFAALLLRALPALLTDSGVDGNLANVFFGFALIVSLVQGRKGIAGKLADVYRSMRISAIVQAAFAWTTIAIGVAYLVFLLDLTEFWGALGTAVVALLLRFAGPGTFWALLGFFKAQGHATGLDRGISNFVAVPLAKISLNLDPHFFKHLLNWLFVGLFVAWMAWGVFDAQFTVACGIVWLAMILKAVLEQLRIPYLTNLSGWIDMRFPRTSAA